jgi:hypothetical protein
MEPAGGAMKLKLKVDRSEIIWSIPILVVLVYLIYYGINAKKITDNCLSYCYRYSRLFSWKIDGDFFGALFLDKSKMFCSCYYPNSDFVFANVTIAELEFGRWSMIEPAGGAIKGGDYHSQNNILP